MTTQVPWASTAAGHPESLQAVLSAEQEELLAEIDAELWPPGGEASP